MIEITHQDKEIIYIEEYEWTGEPDGVYFKINDPMWAHSTIGNLYPVLLDRKRTVIVIKNEYYSNAYAAIEPQLTGDVLILGMGLALLDPHLTTGTSWKWVDRNSFLISYITIFNGTKHEGDAEDMDFLTTLGTFDTILIDFKQTQINDYSSLLNIGGTVIEMYI